MWQATLRAVRLLTRLAAATMVLALGLAAEQPAAAYQAAASRTQAMPVAAVDHQAPPPKQAAAKTVSPTGRLNATAHQPADSPPIRPLALENPALTSETVWPEGSRPCGQSYHLTSGQRSPPRS